MNKILCRLETPEGKILVKREIELLGQPEIPKKTVLLEDLNVLIPDQVVPKDFPHTILWGNKIFVFTKREMSFKDSVWNYIYKETVPYRIFD